MEPAAPERMLGGRYRLLHSVARGGMASVWVAEDTLLARRVAVKTLHPELAIDESLRTRFRGEAVASASIGFSGIVAIYDTGDDEGLAYIVMEYVEGQDLRHLLAERGPLDPATAVRVAAAVATALDHAHRHGIVHRDVKPANVLVTPGGVVKVTDFGIAIAAGSDRDLTGTGVIVGTARYLAPEQVRGERADARADMYATGLVLYEMLTGRLPFHGETEMGTAIARLTVPPEPLPATVPRGVAAIVERCLDTEPSRRFPTAAALAEALDATHDDDRTAPHAVTGTLAVPSPPVPAPPRPKRRRGRVLIPLVVAAFVAAGVGGYLFVNRGTSNPNPAPAAPLRIVSAQDFDPFGNDGQENHAVRGLAIDGNLQTAWPTEIYVTRDFGHGKSGVGIYVTLAAPATINTVTVDTFETGWNAQIYAALAPASTPAGWGKPVATGTNLSTHTAFAVHPPTRARVVLLWITFLPASGKLDVAEIHVS